MTNDSNKQTKVQIRITANRLNVSNRLLGTSTFRPCAAVRLFASNPGGQDELLGETEVIENAANPEWVAQFDTLYTFGKETKFSVTIFNKVKSTTRKKIGSAVFELGEVLRSKGCVKVKKLQAKAGTVVVRVSKAAPIDYGTLHLQLRGVQLMNVEGYFRGKSDPYFVLKSKVSCSGGGSVWQAIYRSEYIKDNLNPKWSEFSVSMDSLCNGNKDRPIRLEVFDWERNGRDRPMGSFQTTVNVLLQRCSKTNDGSEDYGKICSLVDGFNLDHQNKSYGHIMVSKAYIRGGGKKEKRVSRSALVPTIRGQNDVQQRFVPLLHAEGKIYRKKISSYIRPAVKGEEVVTTIDGVKESRKIVDDGSSWVVCAKSAWEHYVLTDKELHESYDVNSRRPVPEDAPNSRRLRLQSYQEYDSKRIVWARAVDQEDMRFFRMGADKPDFAHFVAPWNEEMRVEQGDFLVTQYDPNGGKGNGEVYRVEKMVFGDSYAVTDIDPKSNESKIKDQLEVQNHFVRLMHAEGKIFRKKVSSYIRKATKGEKITTTIDGVVETENTVKDGTSWIVCAKAAGEHYILTDDAFHEGYNVESAKIIPWDAPNSTRLRQQGFLEYTSKRFVYGHEVDAEDLKFLNNGEGSRKIAYFVAPWNEKMRVELNDYLVTQYVPKGTGNNEVYRIERTAFEYSYVDVKYDANEETQQRQRIHEPLPSAKPEFIDYITGGTEVNLMVAIDFTRNNGDPRQPQSLHHFHPPGGPLNDYEKALTAVGSIVARYDSDQMFPVLGFGAKFGGGGINNCFQVGDAPELKGVSGMVWGYRSVFSSSLKMSGPAQLSPVIRYAASQSRKKQDENHKVGKQAYTILLILTNGAVSDVERTKRAIRQASTAPLSIVIVGIGNADFSAMQFLDDFQRAEGGMTRDIVQFVEFSKHSQDRQALTRETLDEIPDQLVGYFYGQDIMPLPPQTESVSEIVEEECDSDDDRAIEIDENGNIILNSAEATWNGQSYGEASHFLPSHGVAARQMYQNQQTLQTLSLGGSSREPHIAATSTSSTNVYVPSASVQNVHASTPQVGCDGFGVSQNIYDSPRQVGFGSSSRNAYVSASRLSAPSMPYVASPKATATTMAAIPAAKLQDLTSMPYVASPKATATTMAAMPAAKPQDLTTVYSPQNPRNATNRFVVSNDENLGQYVSGVQTMPDTPPAPSAPPAEFDDSARSFPSSDAASSSKDERKPAITVGPSHRTSVATSPAPQNLYQVFH